jgi:hypothetical protein
LSGSGDRRVLVLDRGLAAEAAADLRRDQVHGRRVEAERGRHLGLRVVRHLVGGPHRERAVLAGRSREPVRLHRRHGHALVDVAAAHDDIGDRLQVERGIRRLADGDVVGPGVVQHRRTVGQRLFRVGDRGELVDLGEDGRGSIDRLLA